MVTQTRQSRPVRREQIARAALELIGQEGITALGAARLADSVGLSSGAIFRHFASLEEVLDEAVLQAQDRILATLPAASLPPLERLRALARARIQLLQAEPGLAWLLRTEQARLCLPVAAVKCLEALVASSRAFIGTALHEAQGAGQLRSDVPLDILTLTFVATVHALIGRPGLQGRGGPLPPIDRALDGIFTLLAPVPEPLGGTQP